MVFLELPFDGDYKVFLCHSVCPAVGGRALSNSQLRCSGGLVGACKTPQDGGCRTV